MKQILSLLIALSLVSFYTNDNDKNTESKNPFFQEFNSIIDFTSIEGSDVTEASELIQKKVDLLIEDILSVKDSKRTFENTMLALDDLYSVFSNVSSSLYLMAYTHPDSVIRSNAQTVNVELSRYGNKLSLNEGLYKAMKSYSKSDEAKNLTGYKKKFLIESVAEAERNGFALSKEDRDKLKLINDEIAEIGNKFNQNIAAYKDFLILDEKEMDGMSDDYKSARRQEDGAYKIDLSYPSYIPFMKYCTSENARKALFMKYNNRATSENIDVLQELLKKRQKMANLLGYRSYAAYRLEDRMAKTPENVWDFETKLKNDLAEKALLDYEEVLGVKKSKIEDAKELNSWESSYYKNILLEEKYDLDAELVKEYFALDDVLEGLFTVTQTIFDLEYKEVVNASVWHDDVKMYEVFQDGKLKGRFYLDLHPRDDKYGHAACFGTIRGKSTPKGYQIPTATLVCNFPRGTEDKPALMPHGQVETFFHEFGHVLHHMVTTADLISQSGTSVARDFVEAPSQIFENWAWNYDALKLFSKHYKTKEVLPKALFNKMLAAKNVNSGRDATRQVLLGTYDMILHDKYDPNGSVTTTDVLRDLYAEFNLPSYVEGTQFQAAFGHLNGYGSGYYGYMWSKVYAQDMFSVFEENGILDKKTGIRYRDIIMANGSSENELELVKEFLGREPNNKAFLKELGL